MQVSRCVGRVGGLAAALGVGAAVWASPSDAEALETPRANRADASSPSAPTTSARGLPLKAPVAAAGTGHSPLADRRSRRVAAVQAAWVGSSSGARGLRLPRSAAAPGTAESPAEMSGERATAPVSGVPRDTAGPAAQLGSDPSATALTPRAWSVGPFRRDQVGPTAADAASTNVVGFVDPIDGPAAPLERIKNHKVVFAAATVRKSPTLGEWIRAAIFDTFGAVMRLVVGPPALPQSSTITVGTSTLRIGGRPVDANWYFPAGVPQGVVYLQHGVLANGPMYSFNAAYLAEKTNSVVVATTLTSNLFASDGFWLGGGPAQRAVAEFFLGNRDALTASALAAGYALRYGHGSILPSMFVLAGHSLGGTTVSGAAGFYAEAVTDGSTKINLAGAILFDATAGTVLPAALEKLNRLQCYVPLLEIGAPRNTLDMLTASRPQNFNGVVLNGGVHMDSMQGGNPLIEFVSHLFANFPQPQNPPATQILAAGWINDMFAGRLDPANGACTSADCEGIYAGPGNTVVIGAEMGIATAVVIGQRPADIAALTDVIGFPVQRATRDAKKRREATKVALLQQVQIVQSSGTTLAEFAVNTGTAEEVEERFRARPEFGRVLASLSHPAPVVRLVDSAADARRVIELLGGQVFDFIGTDQTSQQALTGASGQHILERFTEFQDLAQFDADVP